MAKRTWGSIYSFLHDNKDILSEQHLYNRFMGSEDAQKVYNEAVKNGLQIHNVESALGKYRAMAARFGFGHEEITEISEGVFSIVFRPTDQKVEITDSDCPSLVISTTDDNGLTINHNMPSMNLPVWVTGKGGGKAGLTTALAAGIDEAVADLESRLRYLESLDIRQRGSKMRYYTNKNISGIMQNNPAVSTKSQSDAYRKAVKIGDVGQIRREAIATMAGQTLTSFFNRTVYNQVKHKMHGAGAPKDERELHRQLELISNASRNYNSVQGLSSYIQRNFPWVYSNVWGDYLQSQYDYVYRIGQYQGTRKEGSPSIISLFDTPTPFANLAPAASNKPAKNLRSYQKSATGSKYKTGVNKTVTEAQKRLYSDKELKAGAHHQALYNTGFLTDDDIIAAALDMQKEGKQIPLDAVKGVLGDSSLYAAQILKDFQMEVRHPEHVQGGFVKHELREKVARLIQKEQGDAVAAIDTEIDKFLSDPARKKTIDNLTREILAKELGVGGNSHIDAKSITYDDISGNYLVDIVESLKNPTFTARAGGTGDFRSVTSVMMNKLLARAFAHHGYTAKEIYNRTKIDASGKEVGDLEGGLRMVIGRGDEEINGKNAWSVLSGIYNYLQSNFTGGITASQGFVDAINDSKNGVKFLQGILSYDADTDSINFDDKKLLANLKLKAGEDVASNPGTIFNTIEELVKFGQAHGIYATKDDHGKPISSYFEVGKDKDSIKLLHPLAMAQEMGRFSGYMYQGTGENTDSRMKFGRNELLSLEETLGKMEYRYGDTFGEEIEAFRRSISNIKGRFSALQEQYKPYVAELDELRSFQSNVAGARQALLGNTVGSGALQRNLGLIIDPSQLTGYNFDLSYDSRTGGVYSDTDADLGIKRVYDLLQEHYEALITAYGTQVVENLGLEFEKEEDRAAAIKERGIKGLAEDFGIKSAADIKAGIGTGDHVYTFTQDGHELAGGLARITGRGSITAAHDIYDEEGRERSHAYRIDDIIMGENTILRGVMELMRGSIDDAGLSRFAGSLIAGGTQDIRSSIINGSIYERFNKLMSPEGGYLLEHAMNSGAAKIFEGYKAERAINGHPIKGDEWLKAAYFMNPEDARAILNARGKLEDGSDGDYIHSLDDLKARYQQLYGRKYKGKTREGLVDKIIDALTLESNNFAGQVDTSNMLWRSPTLKMFDDILGGGVVLSKQLVNQGNILANPDMAAAFKGDFDGDRIAIFNALSMGDMKTANSLLTTYFDKLAEGHHLTPKKEEPTDLFKTPGKTWGKITSMDEILDEAKQRGKAAAANAGYEGAGVYGNLLFGLWGGLSQSDLGFASLLTGASDPSAALAAHMATNLVGSLYQEGINIKNTKTGGEEDQNPAEVLKDIMYRAKSGKTWNSVQGMMGLLSAMADAGITDDVGTGVFKGGVMANLGLFTDEMKDAEWDYYAQMAKQAAVSKDFTEDQQKALLAEAETFASHTAKNFSKELVAYIIASKDEGALNGFLGKTGKSAGGIVSDLYEYIGGHIANPDRVYSAADLKQKPDEQTINTLQLLGKYIETERATRAADQNRTFMDWMIDSASGGSWAAQRAAFLAAGKDVSVLGSPHTVNDYLLGPYNTDNLSPLFNQELNKLLYGKATSLDELEIPPDDIADFKNKALVSLQGTILHKMMEVASKVMKEHGVGAKEEDISKAIYDDPEVQELMRGFDPALEALGYTSDSIEKNRIKWGLSQRANLLTKSLLGQFVDKDGKALEGQILASEAVLPGQVGKYSTTGAADLIYGLTSITKDGDADVVNNILRLVDYKNTKTGRLSAGDLTQSLQYLKFLRTWQEDIKTVGAPNASAYFDASDSVFVDRINKSLNYMADQEAERASREGREFNKEEFINSQYEQLKSIYDYLLKTTGFEGQIITTSAGGGSRTYTYNLEDRVMRGALNMMDAGLQLPEEVTDLMMSRAKVFYGAGGINERQEDFDNYLNKLEKVLELRNKIAELEAKSIHQSTEERALTQQQIELLKQQLTTEETSLGTLREKVTLLGEAYKGLEGVDLSTLEIDKLNPYEQAEYQLRREMDFEGRSTVASINEKARTQAENEALAQFKQLTKGRSSLALEKAGITAKLGTSVLTTDERNDLNTRLAEIDEVLANNIDKRIEEIKSYFTGTKASESGKKKFDQLLTDLEILTTNLNGKIAKIESGTDSWAARKQRSDETDISRLLQEESDANYKVWEIQTRLAKEGLDEFTRSLLILEKDALEELASEASLKVKEFTKEHSDDSGNLDPYIAGLMPKIQRRIDLQDQARRMSFLDKQKSGAGGSAFGDGLLGGVGAQFGLYFKRMLGGTLIFRFIGKLRQEIQKVISQAKELDNVMANVRIVTNGTKTETRNLMTTYSKLGQELGVTTKEVAQSGIEWMRQGYGVAQTNDLITASLYLSKLGMIDSTTATKSLTSALKGFKLEASEAMSVVDKLTAIDLKAATSAGDIAEGLSQFANLGSLSGVDIDQAAAYAATIADVTQMSGSSAGQALKTIISRYGNVKAGAYNKLNLDTENTDTSENLNDVERVLSKIGISIRDTNLQFKDFDEVLAEIAEKWNTLDNVSKKAIANAFAGIRQQEAFVTLLENWDKYEELLETSQDSSGTAETKFKSYRESLEAAANELTTIIENFANQSEISELLRVLTEIKIVLAKGLPTFLRLAPSFFSLVESVKAFSGNTLLHKFANSKIGTNIASHISESYKMAFGMEEFESEGQGKFWRNAGRGLRATARGTRRALLGGNTPKEKEYLKNKEAEETHLKTEEAITKSAKERVSLAMLEEQHKKGVLDDAMLEKIKSGEMLTDSELQTINSKEELTDKQLISMIEDGIITNKQAESLYAAEGKHTEEEIARLREQGAAAEERATTSRKTNSSDDANNEDNRMSSKASTAISIISIALNTVMSALSTIALTGNTHTDEWGNTVNSSEQAKAAGKVNKWYTFIPIVGQFVNILDEAFGWTNSLMQAIDRERDAINHLAEVGQKNLSVVTAMNSNLKDMNNLSKSQLTQDVQKRETAADEFYSTYYKAENDDLRHMLEGHLSAIYGQQVSLGMVLEDYKNGTAEEQTKALKALLLAQKRIERAIHSNINAAEVYQKQQKLQEATRRYQASLGGQYYYDGTNKGAAVGDHAGAVAGGIGVGVGAGLATAGIAGVLAGGIGTAAAVGGFGAAVGGVGLGAAMGVAGFLSAIPVAGWIAAGVVAVAAAITSAILFWKKSDEERKAREAAEREWNSKTTEEQIELLTQSEENIKAQLNQDERARSIETLLQENNDLTEEERKALEDELKDLNKLSEEERAKLQEKLSNIGAYIDALSEYQEYLAIQLSSLNKSLAEEALIMAHGPTENSYLTDMNTEQLKAMGITNIYKAMEEALKETGELIGVNTYKTNGEFSQEFIDIVRKALVTDEELLSVLTGGSYSLREAMALDPNDQFNREILQNFATALHTSIEGLPDYVDTYGSLNLADLLQTTTGINEQVSQYNDLLGSITNGTESITTWMNRIVAEFPNLIGYMSDTPALMDKIMEKIQALSQRALMSQWEELAASSDFFQDAEVGIRKQILDQFQEGDERNRIDKILTNSGATTISNLIHWINSQDLSTNQDAAAIAEALSKAGSSYQLVSDEYKEALSQYIDYNVGLLDKQIDNLTQQRDMLQQINQQREYENRLIEARNKLEDVQNEKKRIYRAGVGWVYESDQKAISDAEKELKDLETEKEVSALDVQLEALERHRDELSGMLDKKSQEMVKLQAEAFAETFGLNIEDGLYGHIDNVAAATEGITTSLSSLTQAIVQQNAADKATVLSDLQTAWDTYQRSIGTENEASALSEYINQWNKAASVGYTRGWKSSSNGFTNNGAANNDKSSQNPGKYGADAVTVGQGGYDKYKPETSAGWLLPGSKGGKNIYKVPYAPDATSVEAEKDTIWKEISAADKYGSNTSSVKFWMKDSAGDGPLSVKQFQDTSAWAYVSEATDLTSFASRIQNYSPEILMRRKEGSWVFFDHGMAYGIDSNGKAETALTNAQENKGPVWRQAIAKGTLSLRNGNGLSLINEFGPEALITPQGTITALPSHTGVVPADITKNLWAMGELAPSILRALQMNILPDAIASGRDIASLIDESLTVNNLTMNVKPDGTFDARKFVQSLKEQAALTRNLKK